MRSDGTLLATDFKAIYTVGPDGKRQTTLTEHGGRFTVRCDGRLVVANGSSTQIEASLLLPNGELDTARGTRGVVTYKPSDLLMPSLRALRPQRARHARRGPTSPLKRPAVSGRG